MVYSERLLREIYSINMIFQKLRDLVSEHLLQPLRDDYGVF